MSRRTLAATVLLLLPGCDAAIVAEAESQTEVEANAEAQAVAEVEAVAQVEVAAVAEAGAGANGTIELAADSFKLAEVTALVQGGTIETAEELELAVNDPEAGINHIDIDADGQIDHVEVVEVRSDARVDFQMKVIPSSRATVTHAVDLATATVAAHRATSEVSFSANFSAGVHLSAGVDAHAELWSFSAPARFEASAVLVAQPLLAWAFVVDRPVYHSVHVEAQTGRWIPPGHLKHGHWKAHGGLPPGHAKGHGGGHLEGGWHGEGHAKGHAKGHIDIGGHGKHPHDAGPKHGSKPHAGGHPAAPKQSSSPGNGPKGGSPKKESSVKAGSAKKEGPAKGGPAKGGGGKGKK